MTATVLPDPALLPSLKALQTRELTVQIICSQVAEITRDPRNREVLTRIASDEARHYEFWRSRTGGDVQPDRWMVWFYVTIARVLGVVFCLKLLEKQEEHQQLSYTPLVAAYPEAAAIIAEEEAHEAEIISLIKEKRLEYIGSLVLGMNDALIELTGALAGFTLALQNTHLVAMVGLITGLAAAMSMASSQYLSVRAERGTDKNPFTAALYTGIAYLITVGLLILPYLVIGNMWWALGVTLSIAVLILFVFSFYESIVNEQNLWRHFGEMAALSLGVTALSFGIGYAVREIFGVSV